MLRAPLTAAAAFAVLACVMPLQSCSRDQAEAPPAPMGPSERLLEAIYELDVA